MTTSIETQDVVEKQAQIKNLLNQLFTNDNDYFERVKTLIDSSKTRLVLSIHDFDKINTTFTKRLLSNPLLYLAACEEAYHDFYLFVKSNKSIPNEIPFLHKDIVPKLGVKDWLGSHTVTPRGLSARLVNKLVCVEGIVTRCSLVHPKLCRSVHVADNSLFTLTRTHYDSSSLQKDQSIIPVSQPKTDNENNLLKMEYALCDYKDFQRITIQEMPEQAPTGQLPRSVEVLMEEDLVDGAKPGDRIRVWGTYRVVATREGNRVPGYTYAFLICNHIEQLRQDELSPEITPMDIRFIKDLASRDDIFDLLSRSIAPSICGHELVKKGLLLQLLGGEKKELKNGMRLRGDIHVLLIGDPSCGKSQLLRFMMNISPLALSTTGRGSSGVGLTAAVTSDKDTGERKLEAGAMVLGDGGLVCIDEFDKMSYEDRVAIHEVMEQQTVTISKAGIQTTLNARASVLAAANPVYGSFDPDANLKSQISFPDSLLTRFDLIYIIRDAQTAEDDRRICSQVLRQLQYRLDLRGDTTGQSVMVSAGLGTGGGARTANCEEAGVLQAINERKPKASNQSSYWETSVSPALTAGESARIEQVLSVDFLRKYIHYAAVGRAAPVLSDQAIECIADFYSNLRQMCASRPEGKRSHVIPTARCLEACVRLATAHAKLKLKTEVDAEDAQEVQHLLLYTLLGELPPKLNKTSPANEVAFEISDKTAKRYSNRNDELTEGRRRKRGRHEVSGQPIADRPDTSKRRQSASQTPNISQATTLLPSSASFLQKASLTATSPRIENDDDDEDARSQHSVESIESQESVTGKITARRIQLLTSTLSKVRGALTNNEASLSIERAMEKLNESLAPSKRFELREFKSGLHRLQSDNKIM